jgi:hypothetical protein
MQIDAWKAALIDEIETAAAWRTEKTLGSPNDPRIAQSQQDLYSLIEQLKALPADDAALTALYQEEREIANLKRATVGEPEARYRDAKEELLETYGIDRGPFDNAGQFLHLLRNLANETISEYRLRA